jgi:UDP-glucose 4-epimerase
MKKKSILISGGAGFIGSHLSDFLLKKGFRVVVIDNLINGNLRNLKGAMQSPNFRFVKADILSFNKCLSATKNVDIVFHLACLGVRQSIHGPVENQKVNAEGTVNLLEAARINKIDKFFYISSSEIYGGTEGFPIKETNLPKPLTIYGGSKLAGEHYAYAYYKCYGLDTTILRIFNNYGPRAHFEGDAGELIPRTIIYALNNISPIVFGNGAVTRDFYYVKDTANVLSDLVDIPNLKGEIINIGTGKEFTIKDIVKKIVVLMEKPDLKIQFLPGRPADVPRLWVDIGKFKIMINVKPLYSLEKGLRETIDYYQNLGNKKNLLAKIKMKNWEV